MSGWPVWTGTGYERAPGTAGVLSPERAGAALDLVARQAPGYNLERAAHLDPDVYRLEMERIWRPAWLFVAHSAELAEPGARTAFDVGDDSVLVVRDSDGEIRAFQNLCRHRGNRLAARGARQGEGPPLIRCPYHDWVYGLDGSLIFYRGADQPEGLDPAEHGLVAVASSVVCGLVFVRLEAPAGGGRDRGGRATGDFEPGGLGPGSEAADLSALAGLVTLGGFEHARVAHIEDYVVNAGWKATWEANPQCWSYPIGRGGYARSHFGTSSTPLGDDAARPVRPGGVTGAALVAPPNLWCLPGSNLAVTARLAPVGLERTEILVTWLVDEGAVEGRDYTVERLLATWATSCGRAWELCEQRQQAVRGPAYRPGPIAGAHHEGLAAFHAWYREAMAAGATP